MTDAATFAKANSVPIETAQRIVAADAYKRLRSRHHPDKGGNAEQFHRIQRAFEQSQEQAQ